MARCLASLRHRRQIETERWALARATLRYIPPATAAGAVGLFRSCSAESNAVAAFSERVEDNAHAIEAGRTDHSRTTSVFIRVETHISGSLSAKRLLMDEFTHAWTRANASEILCAGTRRVRRLRPGQFIGA